MLHAGDFLTLDAIRCADEKIRPYIMRTPTWHWRGREIADLLGTQTEIHLKLELFQRAGTFKARGALCNTLFLTGDELNRGLTTMSSGNHAVAVAYAARALGTSAKVVMQKSANRLRVETAEAYGAEVKLAETGLAGFARLNRSLRRKAGLLSTRSKGGKRRWAQPRWAWSFAKMPAPWMQSSSALAEVDWLAGLLRRSNASTPVAAFTVWNRKAQMQCTAALPAAIRKPSSQTPSRIAWRHP